MYVSTNRISHYSGKWTETQVKHLLRRSLFGVTIKDIAFFKNKNLSECLELLLKDSPPLPAPTYRMKEDPTNAVPKGQSLLLAPYNKKRDEDWTIYLKAQWVEQMINPLQHSLFEKMVLFWHNHFVIQFTTVSDSRYHYQYLKTLRKHALGNFKSLLYEITINPGMLVYLNGNLNNKHNPNENYGRELQELFTIGKGTNSHYSETDVKAAAKVLSGWKDDKSKINSYFDSSVHNSNDKTFSAFYKKKVIKGKVGIDGAKETEELVEMICANPEVANFICRKIYRWFVHSHIDSTIENNVIQPLAEILRTSNYEIKPVLRALFFKRFFLQSKLDWSNV
jgi:uncharacterized protein (DUF1800 family)